MRQKERQRTEWQLRKRAARQAQFPTVLLGCEGETEVEYFRSFRQANRIGRIHLVFTPTGSDPSHLLGRVMKAFAANQGNFDAVFCLFDRDEHLYFEAVCERIEALAHLSFKQLRVPIEAITSNPSFELWLLLHFKEVRRALHRDEAYRELKACCPQYEKAKPGAFDLTRANLDVAIDRAEQLEKGKNPSTAVGSLVQKLRELWKL